MGIYILVGILYILLLGAFYIGFKELTSFKENYNIDKISNSTKVQNSKDFYKENLQDFYELVKSYKQDINNVIIGYEEYIKDNQEQLKSTKKSHEEYIKDNQKQIESIKKSYEEDKVMENYYHMLDLMDKFQKDQDLIKSYISDSVYKLEKYPEKKHLELKRILNTNNSKLKNFKNQVNGLKNEVSELTRYIYEEVPNIKRKLLSNQNQRKY